MAEVLREKHELLQQQNQYEASAAPARVSLNLSVEDEEELVDQFNLIKPTDDTHDLSLPLPDRGRQPWIFIVGASLSQALGWGLPLSFGIFQAHYAKHELFKGQEKDIHLVGTVMMGLAHLLSPAMTPLLQRFPAYQRQICSSGAAICVLSLVLASFATKVWQLVAFQGMLYAFGWVVWSVPFMFMVNDWFVSRRGLANGVINAAGGVGALLLPFILERWLELLGFRWTLRLTALAFVIVCGPGLPLLKPRIPVPKQQPGTRPDYGNADFLKSRTFWLFVGALVFQTVGLWQPRFFLPSFVHDLEMSYKQGAEILALFSLAQILGQIIFGAASDLMVVHIPAALSVGVCAVATFIFWGPGKTYNAMAWFAVLFGSCGGVFAVLLPLMATRYVTDDTATTMTVFGLFKFARGVAALAAGPISAALLGTDIDTDEYGLEKYAGVVCYVGVGMVLSVACICLAYFSGCSMSSRSSHLAASSTASITFGNLTIGSGNAGDMITAASLTGSPVPQKYTDRNNNGDEDESWLSSFRDRSL